MTNETQAPRNGALEAQEDANEAQTVPVVTGKTGGARAPRWPNPKLNIDLSDAEAIARPVHEVAVALAEGRLSGRAGQALMTAIRLAIEARKPAPPPPPPPPDRGPLIRLDLVRPDLPS
jgi:hypothetical protein